MRKKLLSLLLLLILPVCLLFTGCDIEDKKEDSRFVEVYYTYISGENYIQILVDKETRVMYLFKNGYKAGGLTVMVDADGKPLLYEGEL